MIRELAESRGTDLGHCRKALSNGRRRARGQDLESFPLKNSSRRFRRVASRRDLATSVAYDTRENVSLMINQLAASDNRIAVKR